MAVNPSIEIQRSRPFLSERHGLSVCLESAALVVEIPPEIIQQNNVIQPVSSEVERWLNRAVGIGSRSPTGTRAVARNYCTASSSGSSRGYLSKVHLPMLLRWPSKRRHGGSISIPSLGSLPTCCSWRRQSSLFPILLCLGSAHRHASIPSW